MGLSNLNNVVRFIQFPDRSTLIAHCEVSLNMINMTIYFFWLKLYHYVTPYRCKEEVRAVTAILYYALIIEENNDRNFHALNLTL